MILRRDEDGIIVPACSLALSRALSMVLASADTPDTDEDQVDLDAPVSFSALILLLLLLLSLLPLVLPDAEANDAAALVRPLLLLLPPLFFRASDFDGAASPLSDMAAVELALDEADLRDVAHVLPVLLLLVVVMALGSAALLVLLVLDAVRAPVSSCPSCRCR